MCNINSVGNIFSLINLKLFRKNLKLFKIIIIYLYTKYLSKLYIRTITYN